MQLTFVVWRSLRRRLGSPGLFLGAAVVIVVVVVVAAAAADSF